VFGTAQNKTIIATPDNSAHTSAVFPMLDTTETTIATFIVHRVGNKLRGEGIFDSKEPHPLTPDLQMTLLNYFVGPLQATETFRFAHSSDIRLNEMFAFSSAVFKSDDDFVAISVKSLKHLYSTCDHPEIKGGEVSFVLFDRVLFQGRPTRAWGIFKSERKDTFLTVTEKPKQLSLCLSRGIPAKQFDKGCLILNVESQDGFRVLVLDTNAGETRFWHERFLGVVSVLDDRYFTEACLKICQQFVKRQFSAAEDTKEQLVATQRAIHYFSNNEIYNTDDFASEVFKQSNTASQFKAFKKSVEKDAGVPAPQSFPISAAAVRKAKRVLKRNIRLDTKMEVKLNFNDPDSQSQFVEHGYDRRKHMFYYKLYFNKEV
jgi:hypothetical protein